jgi:hypothetical protein
MHKIIALAAIVALLGCVAARAEPAQSDCTTETQLELRGTIVQSKIDVSPDMGGPPSFKFMAIALDTPQCGEAVIRARPVPLKWLGHHVVIRATLSQDETMLLLEVHSIKDAQQEATNSIDPLSAFPCSSLTMKDGFETNMPDAAQNRLAASAYADKFGSGCNARSYVAAECAIHPAYSLKDTVNKLLSDAATGKKLPSIPQCGA